MRPYTRACRRTAGRGARAFGGRTRPVAGPGPALAAGCTGRVVAGDGEFRSDGVHLQRRVLEVETRLPRDELSHRLQVALFWDRLIDVEVEDDAG